MLSVCMIVKNEERYIRTALESVAPCAGEIVVVDTGSTDATIAIAQSFGARIIPFEWTDNFAEARNVSISHAAGDWIMFIDADECIAPTDIRKIPALCANTGLAGYLFTQRNYTENTRFEHFEPCTGTYAEEHGAPGFVPVSRIALFRNRPEIRFSGIIHETVGPSIQKIGGVVGKTGIAVHHYGHLHTAARMKKTEYYRTLGIRQIESTPLDPKPYYDIGLIYFERGDFITAEKYLLHAYSLNPNYESVCSNLGILYFRWHKMDSALVYIKESIRYGKNIEQMILMMGTIYSIMNKHTEAVSLFESTIQQFKNSNALKEHLGFALLHAGNSHRAETIFDALIDGNPLNPRYVLGGIQAKRAAGKPEEAIRLITQWEDNGTYNQTITFCSLMMYAELGLRNDFLRTVHRVEQPAAESGEYYFIKAVEALWNNRQAEAVPLFAKSLQCAPYLAKDVQRFLPKLNKTVQNKELEENSTGLETKKKCTLSEENDTLITVYE